VGVARSARGSRTRRRRATYRGGARSFSAAGADPLTRARTCAHGYLRSLALSDATSAEPRSPLQARCTRASARQRTRAGRRLAVRRSRRAVGTLSPE
jgi:hypothetical protein